MSLLAKLCFHCFILLNQIRKEGVAKGLYNDALWGGMEPDMGSCLHSWCLCLSLWVREGVVRSSLRTPGRWRWFNFYPADAANSEWGVLVITAVYQLCDLQTPATPEPVAGSGAASIDLPSRANCSPRSLKDVRAHVLATCTVLNKDTGDFRHV